jgi:hypothetical protein
LSVDRELIETQREKRRLGGWCEMAASLAVVSSELNFVREAVKIGPERGKLKNFHC